MKTYSIEFTKDELEIVKEVFDATIAALIEERQLDAANVMAGIGLKILLPLIKDMNKEI